MASPDTSTEQTAIIEILSRFIERGKHFTREANLGQGHLRFWTGGVRSHLAKIYGRDAPQLDYFPLGPSDLPNNLLHEELSKRVAHLIQIVKNLDDLARVTQIPLAGKRIFIGHGRSPLWRELKDFIADRLGLPWDEFNREAAAGYTTSERLQAMMSLAAFAFLVMTAEEEHADASLHPRPNVIHEVGLFQGRLGLQRAIVMLEDGCSEFSNIIGLSQIRFPQGNIAACFEEVRRVLEREGLLN